MITVQLEEQATNAQAVKRVLQGWGLHDVRKILVSDVPAEDRSSSALVAECSVPGMEYTPTIRLDAVDIAMDGRSIRLNEVDPEECDGCRREMLRELLSADEQGAWCPTCEAERQG